MTEQRGSIVLIGSIAGTEAMRAPAAYVAANGQILKGAPRLGSVGAGADGAAR